MICNVNNLDNLLCVIMQNELVCDYCYFFNELFEHETILYIYVCMTCTFMKILYINNIYTIIHFKHSKNIFQNNAYNKYYSFAGFCFKILFVPSVSNHSTTFQQDKVQNESIKQILYQSTFNFLFRSLQACGHWEIIP